MRLKAPQGVRRFFHEQMIRVRLSRTSLKKPPSPELGPTAETVPKTEASATPGLAADPAAESVSASRSGAIPGMDFPALLLRVLLFISPLYCFTSPRRPFIIYILIALTFAVCGFYKIFNGKLRLVSSPLDIAVFLLPGLALLSSIGAWDTGEAINLALLLSCCAAIYWIVSSLVDSLEALHGALIVFTASAASAAVLCLTKVFQEGTSYPFADALGVLSAAALLFSFYLRAASQGDTVALQANSVVSRKGGTVYQKARDPVLSAAGYLLILAITGINSAMIYLVLIFAIPLSLWKLPADERKEGLAHFLIYASMAFLVAGKVRLCLVSGAITAGWFWAVLGLLLVLALECIPIIHKKSGRRLRPWVIPAAFVLLTGLLLISSTTYLLNTPSYTSTQPAYCDVGYYIGEKLFKGRDALRIMVSSPRIFLQGTGGGGWEPLSHQYQSFYYQDLPPGAFLQAGVEMGLPGLITLIALWVLFFKGIKRTTARSVFDEEIDGAAWAAFTITKKASGVRSVSINRPTGKVGKVRTVRAAWAAGTVGTAGATWAVFTAALVVGFCSLWQCTLSIPPVSLFLFTLFGLGKALDNFSIRPPLSPGDPDSPMGKIFDSTSIPERLAPTSLKKLPQYLAVGGAALLVIIISLNIYAGEAFSITARQALKKGDSQAAVINYQKAVEKDPLNATYHKELGRLCLENGTQGAKDAQDAQNAKDTKDAKNAEALKLASNQLRKGVHLARGDAELRVLFASSLFQRGQPEEGVRQLETAVLLRPLEQQFYEDLALGYVTAGRLLLDESTQKKRARTYLRRARGIPQLLEKRSALINKRHLRFWSGAPYLGITPKIQLYCGQAAVLLGDPQAARHYLEQAALDVSLKEEAELWQGLIPPPENTNPSGDTSYSSSFPGSP